MSKKSPKNHLNLTLPNPISQNKNNEHESKNDDDDTKSGKSLEVPAIVHEATSSYNDSCLIENTQVKEGALDSSYLIPKPLSTNIYFNKVVSESTQGFKHLVDFEKMINEQDLTAKQKEQLINFQKLKLKIGDVIADDIIILEELGKGNGGVVAKVKHKPSNQVMARKNIHLEIKPAIRTQIMRELQVLHECNSPYIVGYYGSYHVEVEISICMEYMDGGSLDMLLQKAGRFPEPIISHITRAVLKGLIYLRKSLHIIHRDVKPSNILVNMEGDVKLCDFGVSGRLIDSMANSFVGTRSYMAPERLTGEQYNTLSDVWSLGLSLAEIASGIYPIPPVGPENFLVAFSINKTENFLDHINATDRGIALPAIQGSEKGPMAIFELLSYIVDYPPPTMPEFCFSNNFLSFINHCLRKEPVERLSLEMLEKHRFINEDNRKNLLGSVNAEYKNDLNQTHEVMVGSYVRNILSLRSE